MPVKMKQCDDCHSLCSNSASKCQVCGSRNLVKGAYTTRQESLQKDIERANKQTTGEYIQCSLCCYPVSIKDGKGECHYCGEYHFSNSIY